MKFYIVDDDPDLLTLLARVLEKAGHEVRTSDSSRRALAEIPNLRPDCVITDLMMPEMDGFELTRELRRRIELSGMKIIVLSAKSYDFDRRRARELGADGYITKPIELEGVLAQIDEMLSSKIVVNYWGVHGTLPVPGPKTLRYGGNTSCVSITAGGEPLFIFDCGSGIKRLSDHLNTIPFFAPLYMRGNQIEIHGPYQGDLTIERVVSAQMEGVYFPVTIREFGAHLVFRDLREETLQFGSVRIDTMLLSHPGYCLGYRMTYQDRKVCYITDNELYLPGDGRRDERYIERLVDFVSGAEVLITDTTYRDHEYPSKVDWGHSCVSQVADLAARAKVKRLHLFHHDPDQTDDDIDLKVREAREALGKRGASLECEAPAEASQVVL
jgi:CheY-like chemotaxis protein